MITYNRYFIQYAQQKLIILSCVGALGVFDEVESTHLGLESEKE